MRKADVKDWAGAPVVARIDRESIERARDVGGQSVYPRLQIGELEHAIRPALRKPRGTSIS